MTPDAATLAALHARAFVMPRPWGQQEFAALLRDPGVGVLVEPPGGFTPPVGYFQTENGAAAGEGSAGLAGFLVFRLVLDEAELLTVAVEPGAQGQGIGGQLVARFLAAVAARGAVRAFLEVAADNAPALAVYGRAGFVQVGLRRGYYVTQGKVPVDARVMARDLHGF